MPPAAASINKGVAASDRRWAQYGESGPAIGQHRDRSGEVEGFGHHEGVVDGDYGAFGVAAGTTSPCHDPPTEQGAGVIAGNVDQDSPGLGSHYTRQVRDGARAFAAPRRP